MSVELLEPMQTIANHANELFKSFKSTSQDSVTSDLQRIIDASQSFISQVNRLQTANQSSQESTAFALSQPDIRHDLRTPLNIITGYCEILIEDSGPLDSLGLVSELEGIVLLSQELLGRIDTFSEAGKKSNGVFNESKIKSADGDKTRLVNPNHALLDDVVESMQPGAKSCADGICGHLLIVDDESANRNVLARQVGKFGHSVVEATNGREALAIMRRDNFDVVLLDLLMPELNGFEVLQRMREDAKLCHLPVIMISALDELDSVVSCIEAGARDYLAKPVNPVLLSARINSCLQSKHLHDLEMRYLKQIEAERNRVDELIRAIFPGPIAEELKATNKVKPRRHENVAVFFLDLVGFTAYCNRRKPEEVVTHLQGLICSFEEIAANNGVDKIKTIGDAFMATSGLLSSEENPVRNCVRCGLEMIEAARKVGKDWDARVGIHMGPVVAGVVGKRQYLFDVWGDTVNIASRVESCGEPGSVSLSPLAWACVEDEFEAVSMGEMPIKGKGNLELFRIRGAER